MPNKPRFTIITIIMACSLTGAATFAFTYCISKSHSKDRSAKEKPLTQSSPWVRNMRLKKFDLTQPLLMVELPEESSDYDEVRQEFSSLIERSKSDKRVTSASVFLHDFSNGRWMSINSSEKYDPGSILKLTILLAYLKKAQDQPGLLDRKLFYAQPFSSVPVQTIIGSSITPGHSYAIRELIRFMLVESDNQANALLNNSIEPEYALRVFEDLDMTVPDKSAASITMTCIEVSRFLRLLFNSSYNSPELSEYALELLTGIKFTDGIRSAFPLGVTIAHKFGERGFIGSQERQLHETSLIYLEGKVLLLTIMTKGTDIDSQAGLIRELSSVVARRYASPA